MQGQVSRGERFGRPHRVHFGCSMDASAPFSVKNNIGLGRESYVRDGVKSTKPPMPAQGPI